MGSVRGRLDGNGTCLVGKLIVHPEHQNHGYGKQLLQAIEQEFVDGGRSAGNGNGGVQFSGRFELFTGNRDEKNLAFYAKAGYEVFREQCVDKAHDFSLMLLEKKHVPLGMRDLLTLAAQTNGFQP